MVRLRSPRWTVPHGAHWSVGDQALSSATNLAMSLLVASTSSPRTFGALGIIVAAYLLEVSILRGAVGDLYTVYSTGKGGIADRRQAISASGMIAIGLATVHAIIGVSIGGMVGSWFLLFALLTPGLLLQDTARVLLLAGRQPRRSFESNVVWTWVQIAGSCAVYFTSQSATGFFIAWGVGGAISAVYGLARLGVVPNPIGGVVWFRRFRGLSIGWAFEYLATAAPAQLLTWGIGGIAGLEELAAYRGALVLIGPSTVLLGGIRLVGLPAAAALKDDASGLRRLIVRLEAALIISALITTLPLVVLPDGVGTVLLGGSWVGVEDVLPFVVLDRIAAASSVASVVALRVGRAHRQLLLLRLSTAAAGVALGIGGAMWAGAVGSAAGYAIVTVLMLPLWRGSYKRVIREGDRRDSMRSTGVAGGKVGQDGTSGASDDHLGDLSGALGVLRRDKDERQATAYGSHVEVDAWEANVSAYDRALITAAKALGVRLPPVTRGELTSEDRADLEARLGIVGFGLRDGEP